MSSLVALAKKNKIFIKVNINSVLADVITPESDGRFWLDLHTSLPMVPPFPSMWLEGFFWELYT